jgi:G protein-coupled glucose receptor regulating Gpa2 C-term
MIMYPVAYGVIWSLPTAIRIYQTATGKAAPWQLQTVDKACIVIQGFVDAIIYGVNESSMASWRDLFFPETIPAINGLPAEPVQKGPQTWPSSHREGKLSGSDGIMPRHWPDRRLELDEFSDDVVQGQADLYEGRNGKDHAHPLQHPGEN